MQISKFLMKRKMQSTCLLDLNDTRNALNVSITLFARELHPWTDSWHTNCSLHATVGRTAFCLQWYWGVMSTQFSNVSIMMSFKIVFWPCLSVSLWANDCYMQIQFKIVLFDWLYAKKYIMIYLDIQQHSGCYIHILSTVISNINCGAPTQTIWLQCPPLSFVKTFYCISYPSLSSHVSCMNCIYLIFKKLKVKSIRVLNINLTFALMFFLKNKKYQ